MHDMSLYIISKPWNIDVIILPNAWFIFMLSHNEYKLHFKGIDTLLTMYTKVYQYT